MKGTVISARATLTYGKTKLFKEKVDKADLEKLAKLIKIVDMLLQTKVYLFWSTEKGKF